MSDDAQAATVRQMQAVQLAIAEGVADCLLAGDREQAEALSAAWMEHTLVVAKARTDTGERPRLHTKRLELTVKRIAVRAAEICQDGDVALVLATALNTS